MTERQANTETDLRAEMRLAAQSLTKEPSGTSGRTSDLSIDEALLLHSSGWEALELVSGASVCSIPLGVWTWGSGEIVQASAAEAHAMASSISRMEAECARAGGHGVVGVHVHVVVRPYHVTVQLVGSAVRPVDAPPLSGRPFVSDLSARDFALLRSAGWLPVGLAHGSSYVYAPRRGAKAVFQVAQNVELTGFTEALFASRESAMDAMQTSATALGGTGVVEVKVIEGPMAFAHHAVRFSTWGTAIRLEGERHGKIQPELVLSLDDRVVRFEASSLS